MIFSYHISYISNYLIHAINYRCYSSYPNISGVGLSISVPQPHQISPLALYQIPPTPSSQDSSPKTSIKSNQPPLVVNPASNGNLVRPVVNLIGRNSAPGSRRGSGNSLYASGALTGKTYEIYDLINFRNILLVTFH